MALFPAYSLEADKTRSISGDLDTKETDSYPDGQTEVQLLNSDNSEDDKQQIYTYEPTAKASCHRDTIISNSDYYFDCKIDYGNLRVSTLYYPGRPQYESYRKKGALGEYDQVRKSRNQRYYSKRVVDNPDGPAVATRSDAYRLLLANTPDDIMLWERFIDFQEECVGEEAALAAAEEAAARLPASARLRARLLAALRAAAPPQRCLERLRDMIAAEKSAIVRTELWEQLVQVVADSPDGDAAQVTAAAAAALSDTRAAPPAAAAPARLLHAAGAALRAAGHWERLVLLVELLVAMNHAPAALVPPSPALAERAERRLREAEDAAVASGLPLSAVWVRAERLRAAAHWRPAGAEAEVAADPQRAPLPHDVAELLVPVAESAATALSARLLCLAQVPPLPGAQWTARSLGGQDAVGAEAFLSLVEAARLLPPAHPAASAADPDLARRAVALLLDPPHYFTDDSGYLSWVNSLWDACQSRAGAGAGAGADGTALLCWRLRWLRALLALAAADDAGRREAARLRADARALLKRFNANDSPLPFAEFARIEQLATGRERAVRVAAQALRAALTDHTCPEHYTLYIARIVCEVSAEKGVGECALVCAVLLRPLPPALSAPAPADVCAALDTCERRCAAAEAALAASGAEGGAAGGVAAALLPGAGEWARSRAALAGAARRVALLAAARAEGARALADGRHDAARYYEESAEELCRRGPRAAHWARTLAPLFPENAYLALAGAGAALWSLARGGVGAAGALRPARGDTAALALLLPPLLRALRTDFAPTEAEALARAARRVCGGGGGRRGALLWAARLEAEARAPLPRLPAALYRALEHAPAHKWVYVRGAGACGSEAGALADALLERGLRLHALPDELAPL